MWEKLCQRSQMTQAITNAIGPGGQLHELEKKSGKNSTNPL